MQINSLDPLISTGNYSATPNNIKLVHWPLMGGLLHLVQRSEDRAGPRPPRSLVTVPNVTVHSSTASVPITVLLYNGQLLCSFNVPTKRLTCNFDTKVVNIKNKSNRSGRYGRVQWQNLVLLLPGAFFSEAGKQDSLCFSSAHGWIKTIVGWLQWTKLGPLQRALVCLLLEIFATSHSCRTLKTVDPSAATPTAPHPLNMGLIQLTS